jgi:hypothetical protein
MITKRRWTRRAGAIAAAMFAIAVVGAGCGGSDNADRMPDATTPGTRTVPDTRPAESTPTLGGQPAPGGASPAPDNDTGKPGTNAHGG